MHLPEQGSSPRCEIRPLVGPPVDYSNAANWMHAPTPVMDVDAFFIYPTVYASGPGEPQFAPIDDPKHRFMALATCEKMASPFAACCNVFAPYYRQGSMNAIAHLRGEELIDFLMAEPRTDIYSALDYYFEHFNCGRPFFFIAHSQGSMMVKIVLREYMQAHPDRFGQMIAAYAIGYSFTRDDEAVYPCIALARGADDTGVVVSWNTEGPGNRGHDSLVVLPGSACINPISWRCDDALAPARDNLGSRMDDLGSVLDEFRRAGGNPAGDDGSSLAVTVGELLEGAFDVVRPGLADARIDLARGTVVCTNPDLRYSMSTDPDVGACFGPASFHSHDIALYWFNLQENVRTRIEAFQAL